MGGKQYLPICTKVALSYRNGDIVNILVNPLFAAHTKFRSFPKDDGALNGVSWPHSCMVNYSPPL